MKRIATIIATLSVMFVLADQYNIVQVVQPCYGGDSVYRGGPSVYRGGSSVYRGGGHGNYHGGGSFYRGGPGAYRVYSPPVVQYVPVPIAPYYADVPAMFAPPRMNPYYYQPRNSFYYNSPGVSVGIGY